MTRVLWLFAMISGLLAGCRSEKVAFQFRPPRKAPGDAVAASKPAAPPPPAGAAVPQQWPARRSAPLVPGRAAASRLQLPSRTAHHHPAALARRQPLVRRTLAQLRPVSLLPRPATAGAPQLGGSRSVGLLLLGAGVLVLLLVAVVATMVLQSGGLGSALLLLMGYSVGISLILAGAVTLLTLLFI